MSTSNNNNNLGSQEEEGSNITAATTNKKTNLNLFQRSNGSFKQLQQLEDLEAKEILRSSKAMIVNSQPYNPSQQQQQRCIGLNQQQQEAQMMNRMLANQQNSLYGSSLVSNNNNNNNNVNRQSHMLDLANLQQNVFDSGYDSTQNNPHELVNRNTATNKRNEHLHHQQQQHQNDISLYSPSSSTSLLYHIYDQINLPSEQQYAANEQLIATSTKNNKSTILNPANLFGQQTGALPLQQQQQQHQQQLTGYNGFQPQQHPFSTLHQQQPSYISQQQQQGNLMLDTMLRQHHAATLARQHHNRPLSSSGGSSTMSGQSLPVAYGRQARSIGTTKSQVNLTNVLQSGNNLAHLGIGVGVGGTGSSSLPNQREGQQAWRQARKLAFEYRTPVKWALLLILLAFSLMSIIKFTLLSASTASSSSSPVNNNNNNNHHFHHQQFPFTSPMGSSSKADQVTSTPTTSLFGQQQQAPNDEQVEGSQLEQQQDVLKSKLLIGEFVILSQNLSHSQAQRAQLAERIVKLMDQVFLSSEVQRFYSRTEITNIRNSIGPQSGIVVDYNIILRESIHYAAQQFGLALYESLGKSNERLANQANYIIDKSSIRFNTVPDKDLRASLSLAPASPVFETVAPSLVQPIDTIDPIDQMNLVVWSAWSQWSSCVDKNGACDPTRLHSRIRNCVVQNTGAKVEPIRCKQRFNTQDPELEVVDCLRTCTNSMQQPSEPHIMSDAPSVVGPQTAPPVFVGGEGGNSMISSPPLLIAGQLLATKQSPVSAASSTGPKDTSSLMENPIVSHPPVGSLFPPQTGNPSTTERNPIPSSMRPDYQATPTMVPLLESQQQPVSCSNCTSDEICLLLMSDKVPFCAPLKDRLDESGCGGWCKASNHLCQPIGHNAFKCIHDSECLPDEWRCHDSACIPLSKRCDGHSNCYDNSDERDCLAS